MAACTGTWRDGTARSLVSGHYAVLANALIDLYESCSTRPTWPGRSSWWTGSSLTSGKTAFISRRWSARRWCTGRGAHDCAGFRHLDRAVRLFRVHELTGLALTAKFRVRWSRPSRRWPRRNRFGVCALAGRLRFEQRAPFFPLIFRWPVAGPLAAGASDPSRLSSARVLAMADMWRRAGPGPVDGRPASLLVPQPDLHGPPPRYKSCGEALPSLAGGCHGAR